MNVRSGVAAVAMAALLASGPAAIGATALDDTDWYGDDACSIDEIDFYADGTVEIYFNAYSEDDTGYWHLSAKGTLTVTFDDFSDTFLAILDGNTIRAAHTWLAENRNTPSTETCTFRR